MIKLVTILALVAATLGTGCKKKERTEHDRTGTAPKTTETTKTEGKTPEASALPPECTEYRATIERIRTCEALPQTTRDALAQAYQQASSGWDTATPHARESLAASCRSANDAIRQSASACP